MTWREDCAADVLLKGTPFERAGKAPGRPAPIYAFVSATTLSAHEAPDRGLAE